MLIEHRIKWEKVLSNDGIYPARKLAEKCMGAASRMGCIAAGITGQRDSAEDIVQQAITIAIEKNPKFDTDEQFLAWLAGIVRNCALNYRRKAIRRKTYSSATEDLNRVENKPDAESPINHQTGELLANQTSFDDRMKQVLQMLSPDARSCLLLRTVEQLSYQEISQLTQIPEGTAMNLVHRSKKKLRELLANDMRLDHSKAGEAKND